MARAGTPPRFHALLVGGLSATLCLSACTALPRSGVPHSFDVSTPTVSPVDFVAGGPVEGATPERLIQDFLLACAAGQSDDFATARLFLTRSSAQAWNPRAGVQIYATEAVANLNVEGDSADRTSRVALSVPAVASVDETGVMTRAAEGYVTLNFTLVKEEGQWRILDPDDGVVMSQASFQNAFVRSLLYFPSLTKDELVADPRWFPVRRQASFMLDELVRGPREELSSTVSNAIFEGTNIETSTIDLDERHAHIALATGNSYDAQARQQLMWQLTQTLKSARNISTISVELAGESLDGVAVPEAVNYQLDTPIVLTQDGIGRMSLGSIRHLPHKVGAEAHGIAIGPLETSPLAWIEGDKLIVSDNRDSRRAEFALPSSYPGEAPREPNAIEPGEDQPQSASDVGVAAWIRDVSASIDRFGWVWIAPARSSDVRVVHIDGADHVVKVSLLDATPSRIEKVHVSPDGARILLQLFHGETRSLWVGVVLRDERGVPVEVTDLVAVAGATSGVIDATWAGSTHVVTAIEKMRNSVKDSQLVSIEVGGFATNLRMPPQGKSVSAGANPSSIIVGLEDGSYQLRYGALWQNINSAVRELRYPG